MAETTEHNGPPEVLYRGEVGPRRAGVAALLNALLPGLGYVYCGRLGGGIGIAATYHLAVGVAFVVAWCSHTFLPKALLVAALGWLYLQAGMASQLGAWIREHGADYVLKPWNHPLVYAAVFLGAGAGPTVLGYVALDETVVVSFRVEDRNAFPELLRGDLVYGARAGGNGPNRGTLVVLDGVVPSPTVARVVGVPGDEVALRNSVLFVNGEPRFQETLGRVEPVGWEIVPADVEGLRAVREYSGDDDGYEVYLPAVEGETDVPTTRLAADEYFVLADHRGADRVVDSRKLGPVRREYIVGEPLYVWWSGDPETGRVRWRRVGLSVQ